MPKNSIEPALPTGHPIEVGLSFHDLTKEQFAGKTVLDLGSGYSDYGGDLARLGTTAHVLGIDGNPRQFEFRPVLLRTNEPLTQRVLADIGSPLPVADESVDIVIATLSFPLWARRAERIETFYRECGRVLRVGGLLSIYPNEVRIPLDQSEENMRNWEVSSQTTQKGKQDMEQSARWRSTSKKPELLQGVKLKSEKPGPTYFF